MYKLLVVDDEYHIRKGLVQTIRWYELGVEIVGEAVNGIDALEKTKKLKPDIIIADINMPIMNGLDFIKEVRGEVPNIKVVIISGYDEFTFAQKAIELDVYSYLLKPLEEEEIKNTISAIVNELEEENQFSQKLLYLESEFSEKLLMMKSHIASNLAEGVFCDEDEIRTSLSSARIQMEPDYCCIVIQIATSCQSNCNEKSLYSKQLILLGIEQTAYELLSKDFDVIKTNKHPWNVIAFIGCNGEFSKEKWSDLMKSLNKLASIIKATLDINITIAIGRSCNTLGGLFQSYNEALIALNYKNVFHDNQILLFEDIRAITSQKYFYPFDKERIIIGCIGKVDSAGLSFVVESFFQDLVRQKLPQQIIYSMVIGLLQSVARHLWEMGIDINDIDIDYKTVDRDFLAQLETIKQVKEWLISAIQCVISSVEQLTSSSIRDTIRKAKDFIKQNYSNSDLTVSGVAEHLHLSPNYFSNLFKKELGQSCLAYISAFRLEEAQRLLRSSSIRIADVGKAVGYENAQYFCTIFKKYYGKTPAEYRNS